MKSVGIVNVDPEKDRAGWLEQRRKGLGGSDVAKVLGISTWGTPWSVYVEKVGAVDDDESTELQRLGQLLEPVILGLYEEETGLTVARRQAMFFDPDHDWRFCTVDGLVYETADPDDDALPIRGVDAKRSTKWSFDDGIPLDYQAQCQWSMLVTGLDEWDLAVLHPQTFRVYTIEANPTDQATLLREAEKFWRDHVLAGVPPPVEAGDNALLNAVWPAHEPDTEVEVEWETVKELLHVKAQQKRIEDRRNDLEAKLKAKLGDTHVGTVDGEKAISWQSQTGGARRFDEKGFLADEPDVAARFTVERTVQELDLKRLRKEEPDVYAAYDRQIRVFRTHLQLDEGDE